MKILVVCQNYFPEPFRITDICEELVRRGHEVTVITGQPNYPMGYIYDGYKDKSRRHESINGVEIHRTFTIGRRHGILWRVLNYYSFMLSSTRYVSRLAKEFDVVFVNQLSPVMMASAGIKYKKKYGTPLLFYALDLWPDSLAVGGIKKDSLPFKYFHAVSERIYKSADRLLITSKSFKDYFRKEFGIDDVKYLPQYAESVFSPESCAKAPGDTVDVMFAGNVGIAQSVETIIRAAKLAEDIENLRWHIVGDGSELMECRRLCDELGVKSVIFHGRKPLEQMPEYYSMADAMIVTMQKNDVISKTLPGKVQTYMAAGKPIIGAIDGECADVIAESGCGLCGSAEDAVALCENVRRFISGDFSEYGRRSLDYYRSNFERNRFMCDLEQEMLMIDRKNKGL